MAFGSTPKDVAGIPVSSVYVPGVGWVALQGSTTTNTDGQNNQSAGVVAAVYGKATNPGDTPLLVDASGRSIVNVAQIGGASVPMAGSDNITPANISVQVTGVYNGISADQLRGNMANITLINASASTTTQASADQKNYNGRGCIIVLDVTNAGTGSITLAIQGKDRVSGKYYAILTGTAVTTVSTTIYRVYPGLTAAANATANDLLPRDWNVQVTANNANAMTYTVGAIVMV